MYRAYVYVWWLAPTKQSSEPYQNRNGWSNQNFVVRVRYHDVEKCSLWLGSTFRLYSTWHVKWKRNYMSMWESRMYALFFATVSKAKNPCRFVMVSNATRKILWVCHTQSFSFFPSNQCITRRSTHEYRVESVWNITSSLEWMWFSLNRNHKLQWKLKRDGMKTYQPLCVRTAKTI